MDSRHVIISIVDSADMTNYDGVINTERSRRWAKFIDSVSTQTKQPDVVVYCPTGKGEYWDDIKSVASKRLGELEGTTLIFGPSLEGSNTLSVCLCRSRFHPRTPNLITVSPTRTTTKVLSRAVELVEAEIGEEAFGEAWVSVLVFPSRLHSCYVETVYDNIQVNDGMLLGKAQVIVLNKALANKAKDLGHIHETLMMGKIVKTFLRVSMVVWCEC
tara:strand:+ start:1440 stop:2087 length:648 start_codon:yes stop_codon:yes gene_type:complete